MAVELTKEEQKEDWYAVLGVEFDATNDQIRQAFLRLSLRWHPDKNGGSPEAGKMFRKINEAKEILMDEKKRAADNKERAAEKKRENYMAERNRLMGQRRRQARKDLERREKNLGPGGEARLAAVELKKLREKGDALREQHSNAQNAAWDTARGNTKKRRASWSASVSWADNDGRGISSGGASGSRTPTARNEQTGGADPIFPVPSPAIARTPNKFSLLDRESEILSAMSKSVAGGLKSSRPSMVGTGGSKSMSTTPASGR